MALLQIQKRWLAMAGAVMTIFLVGHVLANLFLLSEQSQVFYDWYQQPWIRWPLVTVFVIALLVHVRFAINIRRKNFQARTIQYVQHDKFHVPAPLVTISIVLLFAFIAFHLFQTLTLSTQQAVKPQVWTWFSSVWMTFIYLAGVGILSMHLLHSLTNVLQSLAVSAKQHLVLVVIGVGLMFLGFASVPAVFFWSQL